MNGEIVAEPYNEKQYIFYRYGTYSWLIPYISGLYVLACDVYPDITPEIFWTVALETSDPIECNVNLKVYTIEHVTNSIKLIEALKSFK